MAQTGLRGMLPVRVEELRREVWKAPDVCWRVPIAACAPASPGCSCWKPCFGLWPVLLGLQQRPRLACFTDEVQR